MGVQDGTMREPMTAAIMMACLLKKLGGETTVTQDDVDHVAFMELVERQHPDGSITFKLEGRAGH